MFSGTASSLILKKELDNPVGGTSCCSNVFSKSIWPESPSTLSIPIVKKVIGTLVATDPMYSISTTGKLETWFWGFVPPSTDCTVKSNVAGISGRNVCQKRHASECGAN